LWRYEEKDYDDDDDDDDDDDYDCGDMKTIMKLMMKMGKRMVMMTMVIRRK